MAILPIIEYPNEILSKVAKPVDNIGPAVKQLCRNMADTVERHGALGLAAPQINVSSRIIIVRDIETDKLHTMINPSVIRTSDEDDMSYEGCLSLGIFRKHMLRSISIDMEYTDPMGKLHRKQFYTESACVQHEMDHLNGKLIIDHVPLVMRSAAMTNPSFLGRRLTRHL